ncbi:transmembrane protein, putative (macronuclear) [Tetrahymena thermophila SB210]|uniref:Transmembrane protein, putative n=1 Tax=Tetrahymena thermophila (strain SB210) TaxID=312017 RepID=Q22FZ0_TETTS|nr:transmembrane protein, putative [Tetrahymena thermophila SB210]EAR84236.1 transmembrane protein, putative [Tetrahymena thermophila SB210]|eukprot:XP_001031899.1 transmembrane protein, putative [Tetrahymena thermophila SB210]
MNKLFFVIPILALISSTVFLLQRQTIELQNIVPVTFNQYQKCIENISTDYTCHQSKEYIEIQKLFKEQIYSDQAPESCSQFIVYKSMFTLTDQEVNKNQYFEDCFINEKVRAIANRNECFFKQVYAPQYLLCGGFDIYAYPPYTTYQIQN